MPSEPDPAPPPADEGRERYGEIEIERHVKDDGRALLLYSHRPTGAAIDDRPA
jgi:hypothetical protein